MTSYDLKLYVYGQTPRSQRAIRNLKKMCASNPDFEYCLEIIDVQKHPEAAEEQHVLVTPMLVRCLPKPVRRIIGDLANINLSHICLSDVNPDAPLDKE